jgi:hypothetical protein
LLLKIISLLHWTRRVINVTTRARIFWANYIQSVSQPAVPRIVSILLSCLRFVLLSSLFPLRISTYFFFNFNQLLVLQVSLPYYLVRLSLWVPNCLSLLICGTALTKQDNVHETGAALNLCSVRYLFRSGSKTGYVRWNFWIAFFSVPVQTTRQNAVHHSRFFRILLIKQTQTLPLDAKYTHLRKWRSRWTKNNSLHLLDTLCSLKTSLSKLRNNDSIKITSIKKSCNTSLNYRHYIKHKYKPSASEKWLGYGLEHQKYLVPIPGRCKNFSLRRCVQIGCTAHTTSYPMGSTCSWKGVGACTYTIIYFQHQRQRKKKDISSSAHDLQHDA